MSKKINKLSKKDESKLISSVNQRNVQALRQAKVNVNAIKSIDVDAFNVLLDRCTTQASCIDACFKNRLSLADTATKLVEKALCRDDTSALRRIRRHVKTDYTSRIVSRHILLSAIADSKVDNDTSTVSVIAVSDV